MKKNIQKLIVLLLLLTLVFVGCSTYVADSNENNMENDNIELNGDSSYPREIVDGYGNKIVIEEKPERLITTIPSQTDILFALGTEDNIVAISDYCDDYGHALERIGGYKNLNIEKIIDLEPDIVFVYGEGDEDAIRQIESVGITTVKYELESINQVMETITSIGQILDKERKAEEIVNELLLKKEEVLEKIKDVETKKVFYEVWHEPLMAAGPDSFIDELITLAKGENIAYDAEDGYAIFSVEALVDRNPEVYLVPANHVQDFDIMTKEIVDEIVEEIKNRPGYSEIDAIKNNRIEILEPNIVSRPGIKIMDAFEMIARAIHPEVF